MTTKNEMTPFEIEEYIEMMYPKFKDLVEAAGMTKDQWIEAAIKGPVKLVTRCENCKKWPCESIEILKDKYPLFIKTWYEYGTVCRNFSALKCDS